MKRIIFLIALMAFSKSMLSQKKEAVFDDGTKIKYEMVENSANKMHRFSFGAAFVLSLPAWFDDYEFSQFLMLSYFMPYKFFARTNLFLSKQYSVEGMYFLKSKDINKTAAVTLKSESPSQHIIVEHQVREGITKIFSIGIHGGYATRATGYRPLIHKGKGTFRITDVNYTEVSVGVGAVLAKHTKVLVGEYGLPVTKQDNSLLTFYADLLLFPSLNYNYTEESTYINGSFVKTGEQLYVSDFSSKIGYRIYLENKVNVLYRDAGIFYQIGMDMAPTKVIYPRLIVGIYGAF